jgi:myosin heavy subunit
MSSIGKIFLLINFGLAFGFLFWASTAVSTNAKWKTQYDDEVAAHSVTKTELGDQASQLQIDLNNERTAKDQRVVERDQAQAESSRNREDLDAAKRANEQLRADVAAIKETLDGYNQTIQNLSASKDAAVAEAREKERERDTAQDGAQAAQTAQRDAEEALGSAQRQIADLETNLTTAQGQIAKLDTEIQTIIARTGFARSEFAAQPDIEGRVLQVDTSIAPGLVALNVGSAKGVKRGMTFEIFNGRDYKGQVRVENVHENMCSALILGTPTASIGQGDSAATNL